MLHGPRSPSCLRDALIGYASLCGPPKYASQRSIWRPESQLFSTTMCRQCAVRRSEGHEKEALLRVTEPNIYKMKNPLDRYYFFYHLQHQPTILFNLISTPSYFSNYLNSKWQNCQLFVTSPSVQHALLTTSIWISTSTSVVPQSIALRLLLFSKTRSIRSCTTTMWFFLSNSSSLAMVPKTVCWHLTPGRIRGLHRPLRTASKFGSVVLVSTDRTVLGKSPVSAAHMKNVVCAK